MSSEVADLVQEIAESGRGLPDRYVQRAEDRPSSCCFPGDDAGPPPPLHLPTAANLPVIDLTRLFHPEEAAKLRSALQSWGMFQAVGHGMSASFLDEVRDVATNFFQLPIPVKKKFSTGKGNDFMQGYGNERLVTEDQILDWVDRLYLCVHPQDARKLEFWPDNPTSFRDVLHEYTIKTSKVAEQVLRSMSKVLELDEDYFGSQFGDRAEVYARFNYYPCCPRPDLVFGLKPHSDGSAFTMVLPDKDVEGLQVLKDGEWLKVPTNPHALIINMGDQMEIMSNGIFKSPVHRVVTNPEKERVSIAMFYPLESEKEIKVADGLVDEMRPRRYKEMKTKDYLGVYFQHFVRGTRAIEWAKI